MKKKIFITALEKDEPSAKKIFDTAAKYGLETSGHFWVDDLEKMEWATVGPEVMSPDTALWIISGTQESLQNKDILFPLSLLACMAIHQKGHGFPILIVPHDGEIDANSLPTPLKSAEIIPPAKLGPKVAAKAHIPLKKIPTEYRLDIFPLPGLGLWIETGPAKGSTWNGVMFGVCGGEIDAHGVGPAGKIPDKAVVEYPMKGLEIDAGDKKFTAWAVQNTLTENDSYYVRVKDYPSAFLFGELTQGDDAEVFIVDLK